MSYFSIHNHTDFSNIRLLDSINTPKSLIDIALKNELMGIAISDHECISGHVEFIEAYNKIKDKYPNFKIALGNETYILDEKEDRNYFRHLVLLAKDEVGYQQLRELTSLAWLNRENYRGLERVYLRKEQLLEQIKRNPGHIIASSACIGGIFGDKILSLRQEGDITNLKQELVDEILWYKDIFGDDLYLEVQPSNQSDQLFVNMILRNVSKTVKVPLVFSTDSHYGTKEEKILHSAFLHSQEGDRETEEFYSTTYIMNYDEIKEYLSQTFTVEEIEKMRLNTLEIMNKIEEINIFKPQQVPHVNVIDLEYPGHTGYNFIDKLMNCDYEEDRYLMRFCVRELKRKDKYNDEYLTRLNTEAEQIELISQKLGQRLASYFNLVQKMVNIGWATGSFIGPSRGSALGFLVNYAMGITQIDPVKFGLSQWWRFAHESRPELADIDLDFNPMKKEALMRAFRKEFGEDNVINCATFGTCSAKSAIITACRGLNIDSDIAQYLSSLIPVERGQVWPLRDVLFGRHDEETFRKPVPAFVEEVNKYEGLQELALRISGLRDKRGVHASALYIFDNGYTDMNACMFSSSGIKTTQFSMADSDKQGALKMDMLFTEIQSKLQTAMDLLLADGKIEDKGSVKANYEAYFHPDVIEMEDRDMWKTSHTGEIIDLFQFSTPTGLNAIRLTEPYNVYEATATNCLMRLMGEDGVVPIEKYVEFKKNPQLWEEELDRYNLQGETRQAIIDLLSPSYGVASMQEEMMMMLMNEHVCGFSVQEANKARKAVAKKKPEIMAEVKEMIYEKALSKNIAEYVWHEIVLPQAGYSFSILHSLAYSIIAIQVMNVYNFYPPVYWNCACLTVNAAADEEAGGSTDYAKIATAIGLLKSKGHEVDLLDINKSMFGFSVNGDRILYGLKGVQNIGDDLALEIIRKRPYSSLVDFLGKISKIDKRGVINLIKGGAFTNIEHADRVEVMTKYIKMTLGEKSKMTLQQVPTLIEKGLLMEEMDDMRRLFNFNRYLKQFKDGEDYILDKKSFDYYLDNFDEDKLDGDRINQKVWDKMYGKAIEPLRKHLKDNHDYYINAVNQEAFDAEWNKYCKGGLSKWEMDALSFYYGKHELENIDKVRYGICEFKELPDISNIVGYFKIGKNQYPKYELARISGTVLGKDKSKGIVYLLSPGGQVINVKMSKEEFASYDKQIKIDGKVAEKSWFERGNKLLITGHKRYDTFRMKLYKGMPGEKLYLITDIDEKGELELIASRIA